VTIKWDHSAATAQIGNGPKGIRLESFAIGPGCSDISLHGARSCHTCYRFQPDACDQSHMARTCALPCSVAERQHCLAVDSGTCSHLAPRSVPNRRLLRRVRSRRGLTAGFYGCVAGQEDLRRNTCGSQRYTACTTNGVRQVSFHRSKSCGRGRRVGMPAGNRSALLKLRLELRCGSVDDRVSVAIGHTGGRSRSPGTDI